MEHRHDKHRAVTKRCRSPRVLHNAAVLLWQFFDINERKEFLPDRARAAANDFHLRKRRGGQNGLEEPEDPGHDRWDIHEELARLEQRGSKFIEKLEKMKGQHAQGTRDSVSEIGQ
jgi:hypothetical protein